MRAGRAVTVVHGTFVFVDTLVGMVVFAVVGMRVSMYRTIGVAMGMLVRRSRRHGTDAFMAVAVLAVMVMRMYMRRAIGMGVRVGMFIVRMGMRCIMSVSVTVCRTVFMHVPVATFSMAVFVNGFALDTRFAGGASASGTHVSLLQSAAWLLLSRSSRLRVL
jgi:hypothetical protein